MYKKLYFFYSNTFLKGIILPFYFRFIRTFFKMFGIFAKTSLSQFSEDIIIDIILKNAKKTKGFFVDVGCNHPIEYNNTYLLYLRGWRGINIDGNGKLISLYHKFRNEDINVNSLISNVEVDATFHISTNDKLSTINYNEVLHNPSKFLAEDSVMMHTQTLNTILQQHLPKNAAIDLLCIDVEGHDFEVINSIDLDTYKPYLLVIEIHDFNINNHAEHRLFKHLSDHNYQLTDFVFSTGYFVRKNEMAIN